MGITMSCIECKQKSQDGIIEHLETCTANLVDDLVDVKRQILMDLIAACLELHDNHHTDLGVWKLHVDAALDQLDLLTEAKVK